MDILMKKRESVCIDYRTHTHTQQFPESYCTGAHIIPSVQSTHIIPRKVI